MPHDIPLRVLAVSHLFCVLATVSADVPGPATEVRVHLGRPTFIVDGEPFTRPLFATYVPTVDDYRQMAEIGCEVFNFQTNCSACNIGFSTPTWKAPDVWDFSQMDERAGMILEAKPDGLILPRIYIGSPRWWRDQHPQEMVVLDHGGTLQKLPCNEFMDVHKRPYASLASPIWRADMGKALRRTIEHMQGSRYGEHIFGYEIAALGSEEWYHLSVNQLQLGDYNPHTRRAFQEWLRKKYSTKEMLRQAWKRPRIEFDDVEIPTKTERFGNRQRLFRDPTIEMPVIDFYIFWSDLIVETIDYFAAIVKDVSGGKKAVGAFYNYMFEFRGGPEFGHNAGGAVMRSDHVDFVCAPPSYYQRQLGSGAECYRRPFLPGTLHGKLWFHDNDLASFLFERIMRRRGIPAEKIAHYAAQIYPTPTARESAWLYQRAAGFVLCEGIYESYFDLHGGYFDHPQLLESLKKLTEVLAAGKDHDRSSVAEILILSDELSLAYGGFQSDWPQRPHAWRLNEMLMAHQLPFIKSGAPFDSGLLSDLTLINWDQYKLVVFLNTWHVSQQDRRLIDEKIKGDGRVVVWCYAPGFFQGQQSGTDLVEQLTGIRLQPPLDGTPIEARQKLTAAGRQWLESFGQVAGDEPFGMEGAVAEWFRVADDQAETLAVLAGPQSPSLARKPIDDWTSYYSYTAVVTPEIVRSWAREAGVHVYSEANDSLYANRSFLCINAATAGSKTIQLPRGADVFNALSGHLYGRHVQQIEVSLMEGESCILRFR